MPGGTQWRSPSARPHTLRFDWPTARRLMAAAIYSKRLVGASALLIYAYASYPLAEPTSPFSLSLADGQDSVELDRRDPFAINVRAVAARMGVKHPERLAIHVGEQTSGAAMGANATIARRGACIVLPAELYDAFHAPASLREKYDFPSQDEIDFVLAHESTHIAKNHAIMSGAWLPLSLVASNFAIRKIPNKVLAGVVGVVGIIGSNTLLSWHLEHEADHAAAQQGFAHGGIDCFQRKLQRNCQLRREFNANFITEQGNYLGDTSHPLLTSRVRHLQHVAASNVLEAASHTGDACSYCLKL